MTNIETLLASLTPEESECQSRYDRKQAIAKRVFTLLPETNDLSAIVASVYKDHGNFDDCDCVAHEATVPTNDGMVTTILWRHRENVR